jgi:hypothetical protein
MQSLAVDLAQLANCFRLLATNDPAQPKRLRDAPRQLKQ